LASGVGAWFGLNTLTLKFLIQEVKEEERNIVLKSKKDQVKNLV